MLRSTRQRRFRLPDDCFEGRWLADCKVGKHLAIDDDTGLAQAGDEAAVVETERPYRGVKALDPEGAERALPPLAVAVGVLVRLLYRLFGDTDRVLAPAILALGGF